MQLSSFSQYYIRKLLRQYLKEAKYQVAQRASVNRYLSADLNLILARSGLAKSELLPVVEEIETLVRMHDQLTRTKRYSRQNRLQIEQKIFDLIGLRLRSFLPPTQLITAREDAVSQFKFFCQGKHQEGIQYNNTSYGLILESRYKHDLNIYRTIATISTADIPVILTIAPHRHAIWIELESPAYSTLITYGFPLLGKAIRLYMTLSRFKDAKIRIADK
jgi:hypothetical protein